MAILAGHRLLIGGYFEPCYLPGSVGCTDFQKYPLALLPLGRQIVSTMYNIKCLP